MKAMVIPLLIAPLVLLLPPASACDVPTACVDVEVGGDIVCTTKDCWLSIGFDVTGCSLVGGQVSWHGTLIFGADNFDVPVNGCNSHGESAVGEWDAGCETVSATLTMVSLLAADSDTSCYAGTTDDAVETATGAVGLVLGAIENSPVWELVDDFPPPMNVPPVCEEYVPEICHETRSTLGEEDEE